MRETLFRLSDQFLPAGVTDPLDIQQHRAAVFQSGLGVFFTVVFGSLYAALGSPLSGTAILLITAGLLVTPFAIRRGYSRSQIGNLVITMTWLATFVVASRSGGFSSPSLVWSFLLPLCTYSACDQRSAIVWSVLAALQISAFFVADLAGVGFAQDFSPRVLSILRISGYVGVVLAVVAVLLVLENVRVASLKAIAETQRLLERERLLGDMHDGIGSQLLGLIALARTQKLEPQWLVPALETCVDDLRLIVDSLDQQERSLELALGTLRARVQTRCDASGIQLDWCVAINAQLDVAPGVVLQILRSAQEMLSNALRHAHAKQVELSLTESPDQPGWLQLAVRDHGVGFATAGPHESGRGLTSLRARARRLGGRFVLESTVPGSRAVLTFPPTLAPATLRANAIG